jgi:hypothetical protein
VYRFDPPVWHAVTSDQDAGLFHFVTPQMYGGQITGPAGFQATPVDPAGTFDNTDAINQACASGQPVYFPPGRYHVRDKINLAGGGIITGAGPLQAIIDVGSDFNMSAPFVVDMAPTSASVQEDAQLSDMGIQFYQNAAWTTLGQLIQYPAAIGCTQTGVRVMLEDITIGRGWDGLKFVGNKCVNGNGIINIGCFNTPFIFDGALDYSFINAIEVWPFGMEGAPNLSGIFNTCNPTSIINLYDGLMIDNLGFFEASLTINDPRSTGYVVGVQIGNLHFNGYTGLLKVLKGSLSVSNLSLDVNGPGIEVNGPYDSTLLTIGFAKFNTNHPGFIVNHGGILNILGGVLYTEGIAVAGTDPVIAVDMATAPSRTYIYDLYWHPQATGGMHSTLITQSGSNVGLHIDGFTPGVAPFGPATAPIISIGTDTPYNHLDNVNLKVWGNSTVSVALDPTGVKGYYNLPDVEFQVTSTPTFATMGNFAPSSNVVQGKYRLLGDRVAFSFSDTFATNVYTTAAGGFWLSTNLPFSSVLASYGAIPVVLGSVSNVTFSTGAVLVAEIDGTANPVRVQPARYASGVAWSQLGVSAIPPSTAGIMFHVSGSYPVR